MSSPLLPFLFLAALVLQLLWLSVIDQRTQRIPDVLTACVFATGLLWAFVSQKFVDGLIGACVGCLCFLAVRWLYSVVRGRQGLGLGDVKLLGAAGAWVGCQGLPLVVLVASISGIVFVGISMLAGRPTSGSSRMAFGPHLSLGLLTTWLAKAFQLG